MPQPTAAKSKCQAAYSPNGVLRVGGWCKNYTGNSAGLAMTGFETPSSDYDDLFWAQIVRGGAVALCILPVTRFALGLLPLSRVSDASGLYNLSRNLGGAIGIALIDTVIFTRSADYADQLTELMKTDAGAAALKLGLSADDMPDPEDPMGVLGVMDAIQEASLTLAANEAWLMLAGVTIIALLLIWRMGPIRAADSMETRPDSS